MISPFAGETLAFVRRAVVLGDAGSVLKADAMLERLLERNRYGFGDDIPNGHADCGRDFRMVVEVLQERLLGMMRDCGLGR